MLTQNKYELRLQRLIEKENRSIQRFNRYKSDIDSNLSAGQEVMDNPPVSGVPTSGKGISWIFLMDSLLKLNGGLLEVLKEAYYSFSRVYLDTRAEANGLGLRKVEEDPKNGLYSIGGYMED